MSAIKPPDQLLFCRVKRPNKSFPVDALDQRQIQHAERVSIRRDGRNPDHGLDSFFGNHGHALVGQHGPSINFIERLALAEPHRFAQGLLCHIRIGQRKFDPVQDSSEKSIQQRRRFVLDRFCGQHRSERAGDARRGEAHEHAHTGFLRFDSIGRRQKRRIDNAGKKRLGDQTDPAKQERQKVGLGHR